MTCLPAPLQQLEVAFADLPTQPFYKHCIHVLKQEIYITVIRIWVISYIDIYNIAYHIFINLCLHKLCQRYFDIHAFKRLYSYRKFP